MNLISAKIMSLFRKDAPETCRYKASLQSLLAQNPFPQPLTLGFFYREKMRAIHRIAPDLRFGKILEIGGGQGGLTALIYPHSRIFNIDFDPAFGGAECNRQKNVRFVCGDAAALPFEDDSFDAVTLFDVLEHIDDDEKAISEALRVLTPGGYLLLSTPNENWRFPFYGFLKPICPTEAEIMADWGHVRRGYTAAALDRLIAVPHQKYATFINSLTVLGHDAAFSKLPLLLRFFVCAFLSPLSWIGYFRHRPETQGTETAYRWQKIYASGAPGNQVKENVD